VCVCVCVVEQVPYGIPCIAELLRFLISLINPHDRQNSTAHIAMGLHLLVVACESGVCSFGHATALAEVGRQAMTR
jgi:brefeldin A-resistance guanine nucleotide exchange factor 1